MVTRPRWRPAPPSTDLVRLGVVSTALLTDLYELTMLDGALRSGVAGHRAVFEVFARQLPRGRRYGVLAGTARLLPLIEEFRFGDPEIEYLCTLGVLNEQTLAWLRRFRFSGDVSGFAEGELYFPDTPVLTVEAPFGEALLLETLVLSVLNHDSAVASAAARMVVAARGRPLIEMGGRRTHEEAAVAAARAAWLVGFAATSNLEAGRRYAIPTAGTAAHAFILAYPTERAAFEAQLAALGVGTTLLVDTYDVDQGVRDAVDAARRCGAPGPGAVRIDSGELGAESRRVRALLDGLAAGGTRIVVSGDLDEYAIDALSGAPVDAYGVGTSVATGSGFPTAGFVYKLVTVADASGTVHRVAKRSIGKETRGGRKWVTRVLGADGRAVEDRVSTVELAAGDGGRSLAVPWMTGGAAVEPDRDLEAARRHHATAREELPAEGLDLAPGPAAIATTVGDA
jgi:nicotinate phosphoribosyltransferase